MEAGILNELRDIQLPPPPPDDTWAVLAALVLLAVSLASVVTTLVLTARSRLAPWQRDALARLDDIKGLDDRAALTEAARCLRRAVRASAADDSRLAHATGMPYLEALDQQFGGSFFTRGAGVLFGERLYREPLRGPEVHAAIDGLKVRLRSYRS